MDRFFSSSSSFLRLSVLVFLYYYSIYRLECIIGNVITSGSYRATTIATCKLLFCTTSSCKDRISISTQETESIYISYRH